MLLRPYKLQRGARKAHNCESLPRLPTVELDPQPIQELILLLIPSSLARLSPLLALLGKVGYFEPFYGLFLQLGLIHNAPCC